MPSESQAARMAEPEEMKHAGPAVKEMARKGQLPDFASGKHKHKKPSHGGRQPKPRGGY